MYTRTAYTNARALNEFGAVRSDSQLATVVMLILLFAFKRRDVQLLKLSSMWRQTGNGERKLFDWKTQRSDALSQQPYCRWLRERGVCAREWKEKLSCNVDRRIGDSRQTGIQCASDI